MVIRAREIFCGCVILEHTFFLLLFVKQIQNLLLHIARKGPYCVHDVHEYCVHDVHKYCAHDVHEYFAHDVYEC